MYFVCCVQKNGWGSGRIEGGDDLLGDDGSFSDAADHHTAFAGMDQLHRLFELMIQQLLKGCDGCGLQPDRISSYLDDVLAPAHNYKSQTYTKMINRQ